LSDSGNFDDRIDEDTENNGISITIGTQKNHDLDSSLL